MSRVPWSLVVLALLALPLVSCFQDVGDCPTCPPERSASIGLVVPNTINLDSVRFGLNGPPIHLLRRGQNVRFVELPQGTYTLNAITYRHDVNDVVESRSATISIVLDRGEFLTVEFHRDFPRIVWAPPEACPADARMAIASSGPLRRAG